LGDYLILDNVDIKDKILLLRLDINVPYDEKKGKISDSDRLKEHSRTIKELSDKGAKIVLLAHQGRKGDPDFIHLDQHAVLLKSHVGKKIKFVDDIIGYKAQKAIKSLRAGEILLLDNVRFLDDETKEKTPEEHKESLIVKGLTPLADIFVNDVFSAAHRSHASIVGFTATLPSYAGKNMTEEIEKLTSMLTIMIESKHDTFVIGGAKPKEPLDVINNLLSKGTLEKVLVGGIVGDLFLMAKGHKLGKTEEFLKNESYIEFLPQVKELLNKYKDKIEVPIDVAIEVNGKRSEINVEDLPTNHIILDIGSKTIEKFSNIIKKSWTIGFKGPLGKYEDEEFSFGTKNILEAITDSKAISILGGGHTLGALDKYKIDKRKFTHVSLAGGALIEFLSGKKMPAIEALKAAAKKFGEDVPLVPTITPL
jgi:phosphoglycerate kinase